jgi:hypothetical protein
LGQGGQKPLQNKHIPLFALKLNCDENFGPLKKRAPFEWGGPKIKQMLGPMHVTNV